MNTQTKNNTQIKRIADTLLYAYRIQPDALISNNQYVAATTNQQDTETWVRNALLNLDEKLAECVLPLLVEQFEQYLSNWKNPNE